MAVPIMIKIDNLTLKNTTRFEFTRYQFLHQILIFLHDYKNRFDWKKYTIFYLYANFDTYVWYPTL